LKTPISHHKSKKESYITLPLSIALIPKTLLKIQSYSLARLEVSYNKILEVKYLLFSCLKEGLGWCDVRVA